MRRNLHGSLLALGTGPMLYNYRDFPRDRPDLAVNFRTEACYGRGFAIAGRSPLEPACAA